MTAAYLVISKVYQTLRSDDLLKAIVHDGVSVGLKRPEGQTNPVVMFAIRTAIEGTVKTLTEVAIDFVARSLFPDGEGTELARIFERVDALVNDVYIKADGASSRPSRRGMTVGFGTFDEQKKDYFKHWTYRAKVKQLN